MTPLWIEKLSVLYEKKYLFEIIPSKGFDFNRKLNSLLRLSIYYSIIIFSFDRSKSSVFYIPFVVGIMTLLLSRNYKESFLNKVNTDLMNTTSLSDDDSISENVSKLDGNCRIPSRNNPFMNPEVYNFNTTNDLTENCDSYNNKGVQREIEKFFNNELYRDVNDIFGKSNSQRQFYTVPGNSIPNDQGNFAKWLYLTPKTCKEGNGLQCAANQYGMSRGPGSDQTE
jgi:hypothetical protein